MFPKKGIIVLVMGSQSNDHRRSDGCLLSPVQNRLLALLYGQPTRRFQGAELIRHVNSGTGATHRQLQQLTAAGLLTVTPVGNQKYYQANRASPIFHELHSIVLKTIGLAQPLREALAPIEDRVLAAFVYGSLAAGTERAESDVDLMVISDSLDYAAAFELLQPVEQILARKINPTVMRPDDWARKRDTSDSFASRVAVGPKIWVTGDEAALA